MKTDLIENDHVPKEQLDKLKVNTNSLYKKGFSFPEVAKNDFATELFDELEISEKNFNANLDNDDLYKTFTQTCEKVKNTLQNKYGDQWTDPADGAPAKPVQEDDE
jgi:chaperonin cofactor prefoldin